MILQCRPVFVSGSLPAGDSDTNPSRYTLNLVVPRAQGTAGVGSVGNGLESTNRIYSAYTGIEYSIPVAWWGGSWPMVSVGLSNAPAGMVAETYTMRSGKTGWRIRWPNPTSTASNIVCTITDTLGATSAATWSITVGTSGFFFVDSVGGDNGNAGTLASPWLTIAHARTNMAAGAILYFRTGTYTPTTTDGAGTGDCSMRWSANSTAHVWLNYPGESYIVDGGTTDGTTQVPGINMDNNASSWIQGATFQNFKTLVYRVGDSVAYGSMSWECTYADYGPGTDGSNPAAITITQTTRNGHCSVSNTFIRQRYVDPDPVADVTDAAIKFYGAKRSVTMGNLLQDFAFCTEAMLALKNAVGEAYIVGNKATNCSSLMVGGNWNDNGDGGEEPCGMHFTFNYADEGSDLSVAESGLTNAVVRVAYFGSSTRDFVYFDRNTIVGQLLIETLEAADAGITDHRNGVFNQDGAASPVTYVYDKAWTDSSKWTRTNFYGAASASGVIDSNGEWVGAHIADKGPASGNPIGWDE